MNKQKLNTTKWANCNILAIFCQNHGLCYYWEPATQTDVFKLQNCFISMFLLPNKICAVIVIKYSIMYGPFCVTYGFVLLKWYSYKSMYSLVIFMLGQIFQNEILESLIFSEYYKIIIFSSSEFASKHK